MTITKDDMAKFWAPNPKMLAYIKAVAAKDKKILELGPGKQPIDFATDFCGRGDHEEKDFKNYKTCDFNHDKLPYEDNEFDFVYARHVIEDLYNPFNLLKEMSRVAKKGYIETPSPLAECSQLCSINVKGELAGYRGYCHHRWLVWNNGKGLQLIEKFPMIDQLKYDDKAMNNVLQDPIYWGTFYFWKDKIEYNMIKHGIGQDYLVNNPDDYFKKLTRGMLEGAGCSGHYKKLISGETNGKA